MQIKNSIKIHLENKDKKNSKIEQNKKKIIAKEIWKNI